MLMTTNSEEDRFLCPCCGKPTLDEQPPGTYLICEVCGWEDDPVQFKDPDFLGGANAPSLKQAREYYRTIGMSSPERLARKRQDDAARLPP